MAKLWEDIKKFVKDGANVAAERFEEETTLWKIHRDMVGFKKEADRKKLELGGRVYELVKADEKTDLSKDQNIKQLIKEIQEQLKKADARQKEYDEFKETAAQKRTEKSEDKEPATPKVKVVDAEPVDAEPVSINKDKK